MDPDDQAIVILLTASYGWVPPQVKAVFLERQGTNLTVHLGCDLADDRVQDADEDIAADADNQVRDPWRFTGSLTHEAPDFADWRARGWLPVHLAAEWGEGWTEPCDEHATLDLAPEWTPDTLELARPEFHVRPKTLPFYTEWNFLAALAHAAAGQITPTVKAVNVVVSASQATIYWHLDTPPDPSTARAMNVTALRLRERTDQEFGQCWYVHDPEPPRTARWGLFFKRDDPRTWDEREEDDPSTSWERV